MLINIICCLSPTIIALTYTILMGTFLSVATWHYEYSMNEAFEPFIKEVEAYQVEHPEQVTEIQVEQLRKELEKYLKYDACASYLYNSTYFDCMLTNLPSTSPEKTLFEAACS